MNLRDTLKANQNGRYPLLRNPVAMPLMVR